MSDTEGFEVFVTIVESGSLTAAAAVLHLPRPTLSRRLAKLEDRLGVRLIHRTTRRLSLTRPGNVLYETARRVLAAARDVEDEVRRLDGVPRGLLRLSVPAGVPRGFFGAIITDFLRENPEVSLELMTSSVHADLVADGFDLALRTGPIEDTSLVARTVVRNNLVAVASPGYISQHGLPDEPKELANHNCIMGFRAGSVPELRWPLRDGGWIEVSGTLSTNQMDLRQEAARLGLGITLLIERTATDDLAKGDLVTVLPEQVGREESVRLVYPDREFVDPKVRAFIDFFMARLQSERKSRMG